MKQEEPRHLEVEQQEDGRRSTIAAIHNRRAEAAAKDGTRRRQHHKEGQRRLDWDGTPASWLPDSEEPHLPGPDAQEAKGDGASSSSKPPNQGG